MIPLILALIPLLVSSTTGTSTLDARSYRQLQMCTTLVRSPSTRAVERLVDGDSVSPQYINDSQHWASSSSNNAECSVEPGSSADVGIILQIIASNKTPFAVKGGGHTTNPGFSSATGVQIAMSRFSQINYDAASQTVVVGSGLIWDNVYAALSPYGVNVIGKRVSGVGVARFTLGKGYSWLSNQYGLTIDTVTAHELVLPNGTVTTVTNSNNPDLFFALRGGGNNFGIVTAFTLKTFPQGQVWGGLINYSGLATDLISAALVKFSAEVTDPKASIITTYNVLEGVMLIEQLIFYDGPSQPPGIFDDFLSIPSLEEDIKTRDFLSMVQASPSNATRGTRAAFHTQPFTDLPLELIEAIVSETERYGLVNVLEAGVFVSYEVEPFLPSLLQHNPYPSSAYPASRAQRYLPFNIYYAWALPINDEVFHTAIQTSANHLKQVAEGLGQSLDSDVSYYSNYAIAEVGSSAVYGSNLGRLSSIRGQVDPQGVMALAGGFKV